jgi:hypothetical protein
MRSYFPLRATSCIGAYGVKSKTFLQVLFFVVLANFLAQIVYLIHQYGGHASPVGAGLMLIVFAWFLAGYILLWRQKLIGLILMFTFLSIEFLFYLSTQVTQAISGQGILLHVLQPSDPILFIVFGIGYINFIAAAYFIIHLLRNRQSFVILKGQ